jgi:SAM-dependent methyltransferase
MSGPCPVCGASKFELTDVLWPGLIDEWKLSAGEVRYINRQQGLTCAGCGNNLRSMALAAAMLRTVGIPGPLESAVGESRLANLRILELNPAGGLTPFLDPLSGHCCLTYPEVDLERLDLPDAAYDVVLHSDTLEHVPSPERALSECLRVIRPGGACIFTVPIVTGRLSRSRRADPPSYHGEPGNARRDYLVHTEFGADVWAYVLAAGFRTCTIDCTEFPAGLALVARR